MLLVREVFGFRMPSSESNNDAALTSAILDCLIHHAETIVIEGESYRMKEQVEN